MSITDVALEHPECARVLHSLGVTLCGPDERSLEAVCDAAATPSAEVYLALHRSMRERAEEWPERDWARMSSPALVGHIIERHHGYVREVAPAILHMAEHLARAHRHAEVLHHARDLFDTLAAHLDYEEQSLFPTLMMHAGGAANEAARRGLTVTHADHNEIDTAHKRLQRCARGRRLRPLHDAADAVARARPLRPRPQAPLAHRERGAPGALSVRDEARGQTEAPASHEVRRRRSANTPPAVTAGPAPGPCTTRGRVAG